MIAPLRRRHRAAATALAVALPLLFAIGVASRRPIPAAPAWETVPAIAGAPGLVRGWLPLVADNGVVVRMRTGPAADGSGPLLALQPEHDLQRPGLLVYRVAGAGEASADAAGAIPGEAILLGSLAGTQERRFRLSDAAHAFDGTLLLYSLGHQEVVARLPLPKPRSAG